VLVVGTGALASFLLPRLGGGGHSLQVFGIPSLRLQALQRLSAVTSDPRAIEQHDLWLVVCKAWQNRLKAQQLQAAPRPRGVLVLQNGLEPERDWLGFDGVERGLCTYGVATVAPGLASGGQRGEIVVAQGSPWIGPLRNAGLLVRQESDMRAAVWAKLVVNASLNVVAALSDLRNGEVWQDRVARRWAIRAAREVAGLAACLGVALGGEDPVGMLERVADGTAGNVCSTLADLRGGRPTEYDSINGALLSLARAHHVSMPVLEELDRRFSVLLSRSQLRRATS
jgi:2-dehydropantoate 2-reductase